MTLLSRQLGTCGFARSDGDGGDGGDGDDDDDDVVRVAVAVVDSELGIVPHCPRQWLGGDRSVKPERVIYHSRPSIAPSPTLIHWCKQ